MPRALPWSAADDARAVAALLEPGATLRSAAKQLGVSRSSLQRRAKMLAGPARAATSTREREDAGAAPLPPGHPISWGAIAVDLPGLEQAP